MKKPTHSPNRPRPICPVTAAALVAATGGGGEPIYAPQINRNLK